jgi:hypothetical protein
MNLVGSTQALVGIRDHYQCSKDVKRKVRGNSFDEGMVVGDKKVAAVKGRRQYLQFQKRLAVRQIANCRRDWQMSWTVSVFPLAKQRGFPGRSERVAPVICEDHNFDLRL